MRAYRKVDEPYELKIEGGRLVLVGVGAVLTLVLVFLVGVLVGKGLWGGRPEAATAMLPASAAPQAEPPKPQYTFYDELTKRDGEVPGVKPEAAAPAEPMADTPVSAPAAPLPPGASPGAGGVPSPAAAPVKPADAARVAEEARPAAAKPVEPAKPAAAPKVAEAARPAEPAKPPPAASKPAPAAKEAPKAAQAAEKPKTEPRMPTPQFTVQVGSFRDKASADDQAKKIAAQGVAAQVVAYPVEGRTWYRVQVGRFDTRADAEAHYQKKLRAKGVQGFVTVR